MCTNKMQISGKQNSGSQSDITTNNLDVCILTEIWIRVGDSITDVQMCPPGYKVYSVPRKDRSGGDIAVIY